MKVGIVYDRVNKWGGAERLVLSLHELFPDAPLFTSVYSADDALWARVFPQVIPSFLQKLPGGRKRHELLAPLMPMAFETLEFEGYDLVISVSSEAGKGIITDPDTKHISYVLTPTRYLWSGYEDYFKNKIFRKMTSPIVTYLKRWDKIAGQRGDVVVAISSEVQKRIKKYYGREAEVIFPPVNIEDFSDKDVKVIKPSEKYFLIVSRLVGYKRIDLAIKALNEMGSPLIIVGVGREERKLKKLAGKNITFAGYISDEKLGEYYRNAKAVICPQEEDFGIVMIEAQAHGIPVIAYNKGGSLDSVIPGKTGVFFDKQEVKSLREAIRRCERMKFNVEFMKNNAKRFSRERFKNEFLQLIKRVC